MPEGLDGKWYIAGDDPFRQTYITIDSDRESGEVLVTMEWGLAELIRGEHQEGEAAPAVTFAVQHIEYADQNLFDARIDQLDRGYSVTSLESHLLGKYEAVGDCRLYWVLAGDDVIKLVADEAIPHVLRSRRSIPLSERIGNVGQDEESAELSLQNSDLLLTADSERLRDFLVKIDTMGPTIYFLPLPICPGELPTTPEDDFDEAAFEKEHPEMAALMRKLKERFGTD